MEKDLARLKKEYEKNSEEIQAKDFDIFGAMVDDHTKIKAINNTKHREVEKDKYKILNINMDTDIKVYTENLENYMNYIKESLNKIKSPLEMSVYCLTSKKNIDGLNIFNINPRNEIEKELSSKKTKITLCKINLKENAPSVFYTNIIFYDNFNKTLPVGMDLSSEMLMDVNKIKIEFEKEESFYINYKVDEFEYATKEIRIYEYNECE